eukprot:2703429-Karenia_brevis.AAC.1
MEAEQADGVKRQRNPEETLVLVSPFDGIGGARRALEILGLKPALHLSFETDPEYVEIVEREWRDVHTLGDVADFDERE